MKRIVLALCVVGALGGCEDAVDPTLGLDVPFSLYGYLDPTADRQALRVVPVTDQIAPADGPLDAVVTSTDLETGRVTTWRDSLATFGDGSTGWVVVADYTPRPGASVRVEALRSDGARSVVDVEVPALVPARVAPEDEVDGDVFYPIEVAGAPRVLSGRLQVVLADPGDEEQVVTVDVPLFVEPSESAPQVWTIDVPFLSSVIAAIDQLGPEIRTLRFVRAEYRLFVASEAWDPPVGDPDALVEPGTFSNVDGGFGFVGGGYFVSTAWAPSLLVQARLGFNTAGGAGAFVKVNEVAMGPEGWVELYNPLSVEAQVGGFSLTDDDRNPTMQVVAPAIVPAQGFLVLPLTFVADPGDVVWLFAPSGGWVNRLFVDVGPSDISAGADEQFSYGSWPDGRSLRFQRAPDVFQGLLLPTPGSANELPGRPAVINEVYTEGGDGFVEAYLNAAFEVRAVLMVDEGLDVFGGVLAQGGPFAVNAEASHLRLPQGGGEVYLFASYTAQDAAQAGGFRIVDIRGFEGQTPGRSVGYLPDGPGGVWTRDLAPTRGAANAAARRGL